MTVHARGYRRHEGGTERPRLRFLPIVAEGYRAGTRGKAFRRLGLLFVVIVVFHGVMLYLDPAALFPRRMRGGLGQVTSDDLMRRVLAFFARSLAGLVPLVAMFVGAGSVAVSGFVMVRGSKCGFGLVARVGRSVAVRNHFAV